MEERSLYRPSKQRAAYWIRHVTCTTGTGTGTVAKTRVVFVEHCNEWAFEGTAWDEGKDLLTAYLKLVRHEQRCGNGDLLFGAVAVGPYVRLYRLEPGETEPRSQVRVLEVCEDRAAVHFFLTDWVHEIVMGRVVRPSVKRKASAAGEGEASRS